MGTRQN